MARNLAVACELARELKWIAYDVPNAFGKGKIVEYPRYFSHTKKCKSNLHISYTETSRICNFVLY
jgi:hypothetical protein